MKLLVIGITGITGGGKTVLATALNEYLNKADNSNIFPGFHIETVKLLQLDAYFYARDSPNHTWIPKINYINRELVTAMDMDRFVADAEQLVAELSISPSKINSNSTLDNGNVTVPLRILIIEGFFIFKCARIRELCNMRLHVDLSFEVGLERRLIRTFKHINPQPIWYFKNIIWPSYQQYYDEIRDMTGLIVIDGEQTITDVFDEAVKQISNHLNRNIEL